ncbi:MAG TPA: type III-A CRISPR-associated protein Csm2 [Bryobacteraceae bacterium]
MEDEAQTEATPASATPAVTEAPPKQAAPKQESKPEAKPQDRPRREDRPPQGDRPGGGPPRGDRRDARPDGRGGGERRPEGGPRGGGDRGDRGERGGPRPGGGGRPFEMAAEIEIEKLISDSLYLDNQAHAVVARMRDMDSGTKSQLRRLYNAVRRAVRAPESERQHQFVMLRARLAYTIARHSLRSLDALERLLLQVTRKNDARGYERFKDLFEAIVAYNE